MHIDRTVDGLVPGADVSTNSSIGPVFHQAGQHIGPIIYIDVAVDQPLVLQYVDLSGG